MPSEFMREWWPLAVVACAIVGVGGWMFTRFVIDRLEKDRTKLHAHGNWLLNLHDRQVQTEETTDALLGKPYRERPTPKDMER